MPYVSRNERGRVIEVQASKSEAACEWLAEDHPDIKAFLLQNQLLDQARQGLASTDLEMVRITEDLIELLITKNVFLFTELPLPVQQKLGLRKRLRKDLNALDNLIGEEDGIF